jgi:hypothetical protein
MNKIITLRSLVKQSLIVEVLNRAGQHLSNILLPLLFPRDAYKPLLVPVERHHR